MNVNFQLSPIKRVQYPRNFNYNPKAPSFCAQYPGYEPEQNEKPDIKKAICRTFENIKYSLELKRKNKIARYIFEKGKVKRNDFISRSVEERKILSDAAKEYTEKLFTARHKAQPSTVAKSGRLLKNKLDELYGKDNYRIISVGTSPFSVCQAMEYSGCEVIYMPVSGLHGNIIPENDKGACVKRYPNVEFLMRFLRDSGIDDKKKNILLDFCLDGDTLRSIKSSIEYYFGYEPDDVIMYDIVKLIKSANDSTEDKLLGDEEFEALKMMMWYQDAEKTACIPHFNVEDSLNVCDPGSICRGIAKDEILYEKISNFSTPLSRAYSLCILDYLENT